jgi:hypothetical protein
VDIIGAIGIIPTSRRVGAVTASPTLDYTSVLNVVFLAIAAALVIRFLSTGGRQMLRMMNTPPEQMELRHAERG